MFRRHLRSCAALTLVSLWLVDAPARAGEAPSPADSARPGADAVRVAAQTTNEFAFALHQRLAADPAGRNVLFSPYSLIESLLMAAEGARGTTAREIGEALRCPRDLRTQDRDRPWNLEILHAGVADLDAALLGEGSTGTPEVRAEVAELRAKLDDENRRATEGPSWDPEHYRLTVPSHRAIARESAETARRLNALLLQVDRYEIGLANALWVDARCRLRDEFTAVLAAHYGTGSAMPLDFATDPTGAAECINGWVAEQTRQRIRALLSPGMLNEYTRLVITNAVAFRGQWACPFPEAATESAIFHLADGGEVTVPFMSSEFRKSVRYAAFEGDGSFFPSPRERPPHGEPCPDCYPGRSGFAMVELPYKGERLSMIVIAPNRPDGLARLESRLSAERVAEWVDRLESRPVFVGLPRFRFEARSAMQPALEALGMRRAFDQAADFSGMVEGEPHLFVSAVLHQAGIEVTEKGTEVVAATALSVEMSSVRVIGIPFVPEFRADRPFLFLIRDRPTGAILFLGRLMQPEGA